MLDYETEKTYRENLPTIGPIVQTVGLHFTTAWLKIGAGLRNVQTCSAEQGPPHFRVSTPVQKITKSKLPISKTKENV